MNMIQRKKQSRLGTGEQQTHLATFAVSILRQAVTESLVQCALRVGGHKMANEKLMSANSTLQRALGIIEGVMLIADDKTQQTLATVVEMIDGAWNEVLEDGK
jgi:hypothetical protein